MHAMVRLRVFVPAALAFAISLLRFSGGAVAGDAMLERAFSAVPMMYSNVVFARTGGFRLSLSAVPPPDLLLSSVSLNEVDLLSDPHVQNELGLDESQTASIVELRRRHVTAFGKLRRKAAAMQAEMRVREPNASWLNPRVQQTLREIYDLFLAHRRSVHREIRDLVSASELERLYQLEMRRRIMQGGIVSALILDDGIVNSMRLEDEFIERVAERVRSARAGVLSRTLPVLTELTEEIEEVLDPRQRSRLKVVLLSADPVAQSVVEHLMWQCRYAQDRHSENRGLIKEVVDASALEVKPCGRLEPGFPTGSFIEDSAAVMMNDGQLPVQADVVDRYNSEFMRRTRPLSERVTRLIEDWRDGRVDYPKFVEEYRRLNIESEQLVLDILRSALSPRQMERATELIQQRLLIQRGLLPSLNDGSLGRSLKLTDAQRRRIREIAAKFLPKFRKLSIELEAYVWKEIKAALPPEQRSRLSRLVGPSPKKMPGSPNLILMSPTEYRSLEIRFPKRLRETIETRYKRLGITPANEEDGE